MPDADQRPPSEAVFRAMMDRAPDLVFRFRLAPDAAFEYVNEAALRVTGRTAGAFLADPALFRSVMAPEAAEVEGGAVSFPADAPPRIVHQVDRPDGGPAWIEVDRTPVRDDEGRVAFVEGFVRDAGGPVGSEPRATLEARIIGATRDAVIVSDQHHGVIFWNAGAERILGITGDEALGRRIQDLLGQGVVTGTAPLFAALEATLHWEGDLRRLRPDGTSGRLAVVSFPLVDEGAGASRVLVVEDVTTERARTEVDARLAAIVEQADDAIYTLDLGSRVLTWNRGAERLTGLAAEDVVGGTSPLAVPSYEDRAGMRRLIGAGETVRLDPAAFRRADGTLIPISILAGPVRSDDGEVVALAVIARDERPREGAERELRFRDTLLGAVRDAVIATSADLSLRYWSPAAEALFGIPADEALGHRLDELMDFRLIDTTEAQVARQMRRGETFRGDVTITRHDGTSFIGEVTSAYLPGSDGSQMSMAVIRDVTEARRAAADGAQLAAIVESAGSLIVGTSLNGVIRTWNPGAERLLGRTAEDMIGRTIATYVPIELLPQAMAMQDRVVTGGQGSATGEMAYVARDGTRIPVSVTVAAIRDGGGAITGISAVAQDLRTRKALEEQLRQAQKLEAIGRLAGGIAADFNNLLTAVTGYGSLLEAELPPDSPALGDVHQILRATERATELTRGLLAFTRGRPRELQVVALDPLVADLLPMLRQLVPDRVEMVTAIGSHAGLRADPTDLELVLVNLVVNAGEAMPAGGHLRIETSEVELDAAFTDTHLGVTPGRHVQLLVADTGAGMTEDVQAHIFEPFFTTKAGGASLGMGLATVHANVERSGGTIWVDTAPGRGTTFRILFPAAEIVAEPVPAVASAVSAGGTERVLLVEDDALVRALATAVLRRGGYEITVKADPRDALAVDPDEVDLLVTDVVMPGITGPLLAAHLLERRPDLPVLFMSGFAERADTSEIGVLSSQPLLAKPFTPAGLLAAVRSALDA